MESCKEGVTDWPRVRRPPRERGCLVPGWLATESERAMGVPAFFKWLSTKYPKIVVDCTEERATWTEQGQKVPVDTSQPNPNDIEFE